MTVSEPPEDCCALVPDAKEALLTYELNEPSSSVMLPVLLKADDLRFGFGRILLLWGVALENEDDFLFKPGLKTMSETFLGRGELRLTLLCCGGSIVGGCCSASSPEAAATAAARLATLFCACSSDDVALTWWALAMVVVAEMLAADVETAFRTALRASSIIV